MTILITLPLPPRELSPNARPHRMAKARAAKKYRRFAWAVALEQIGRRDAPRWSRATARARFYFRDRRSFADGDNLLASLKPAFDGVADAGVVRNDRDLKHEPVDQEVDLWNPRVEIEVVEG